MGPARGRDAEWRSVGHGGLTGSSSGTRRCFPFPFGRGPLTVFSFLRQKHTTCRNRPGVCETQNSSCPSGLSGLLNQSRLGSLTSGCPRSGMAILLTIPPKGNLVAKLFPQPTPSGIRQEHTQQHPTAALDPSLNVG